MSRKPTSERLSEADVDDLVVAQADNDSSWDETVRAKPLKWRTVRVPEELAARAGFLATLRNEARIDDWIRRIIRERIELEEATLRGQGVAKAANP